MRNKMSLVLRALVVSIFTIMLITVFADRHEANAAIHVHSYRGATCTSPRRCTRCGATSGSALGHSYSSATCTSARRCTRCGATSGSALGHSYSSATCTSARRCTRCGATSGSALGHNVVDDRVQSYATCTSAGVVSRKCSRCGAGMGSRTTAALGHNYVTFNCTQDKCSRCSSTRAGGSGHNTVDDKVQKAATCSSTGVMSLKCSKCNAGMGSRTIAALGHSYKTSIISATCTDPQYTVTTCTRSGCTYSSKTSSNQPAGHKYIACSCTKDKCSVCGVTRDGGYGHNVVDDKVQKAATCTTTGVMSLKCSRCNAGMGSRTIAAYGHSYKTSYTNPTCEMPGFTVTTCTNYGCTYSVKSGTTQPLGHIWNTVSTTKATCTTTGITVKKCSRSGCDKSTTTYEAALGHILTKATCSQDSKCTRTGCGYVDAGSKLGHDYSVRIHCSKPAVCSRCRVVDPSGKAAGHNYSQTDPCTFCGLTRCDLYGHTEGSYDPTNAEIRWVNTSIGSDETHFGELHKYKCEVCGEWSDWVPHTYYMTEYIGNSSHALVCLCGTRKYEACTLAPSGVKCIKCNAEGIHVCAKDGNKFYTENDRDLTYYGHTVKCVDPNCPGVVESHTFVDRIETEPPKGSVNWVWLKYEDGTEWYYYRECTDCKSTDYLPDATRTELLYLAEQEAKRQQEIASQLCTMYIQLANQYNIYDEPVVQKFTAYDIDELANEAISGNKDAKCIVIGRWDDGKAGNYKEIANRLKARFFTLDAWDDYAADHDKEEMWAINRKFLLTEMENGTTIYMSHDPDQYLCTNTSYAKELSLLKNAGYKFEEYGDIWIAKPPVH